LCGEKWQFEIVLYLIRFEAALKSEIRISKHKTNSNDINLNDINEKRQYHTAFVLNFEHFDIVSANLIKRAIFEFSRRLMRFVNMPNYQNRAQNF